MAKMLQNMYTYEAEGVADLPFFNPMIVHVMEQVS